MIIPGIREMPLAEQAVELANWAPPTYWNDTVKPFREIGLGDNPSDETIGEIFENKDVLDIGSGAEGIARRLFKIFRDSEHAPRVVNLNPQLRNEQFQRIISEKMRIEMLIAKEDVLGYMKYREQPGRVVTDQVVQGMLFEDESFDIQVSTWAFPNCLFDCQDDFIDNGLDMISHAMQGYREILRTQRAGGIALLAPIRNGAQIEATEIHLANLPESPAFLHNFEPTNGGANVLHLNRA